MSPRSRWLIGAALFAVAALLLLVRWQPANQVRVHTESLLDALEDRHWKRVNALLAAGYSDAWGHDKTEVQERLSELFRQFPIVDLKVGNIDVEETGGQGVARSLVTLQGRGGPFAEMAIQRVAALRQPFVFTWRKQSWQPWDWVLERVEQPELKVESW